MFGILQNSSINVTLGNFLSDPISQKCGVPQGDRLSPLLFALFIADLPTFLAPSDCDVTFYADDLAIGSSFGNDIQHALTLLSAFCEINELKVNIKKTEVMAFKRGGSSSVQPFRYLNQSLSYVKHFVYLGVKLTPCLSWRAHLEKNLLAVKGAASALLSNGVLSSVNLKNALRLYHAIIVPKLLYGLESFGESVNRITVDEFIKKAAGFYFKLWAGLPQRYHTTEFLAHTFDGDILGIANAYGINRRKFAAFYSDGMHSTLCSRMSCYRNDEDCICCFCGFNIETRNHMSTCTAFPESWSLKDRLLNCDV